MTTKNKKKLVLTLNLDKNVDEEFRRRCDLQTRSMAQQVEHLIKTWLAEEEQKIQIYRRGLLLRHKQQQAPGSPGEKLK